MQVTDAPLTCLANSASGEHIVTGSARGSCAVLQLSRSVWNASKEEKGAIVSMLEREGLRCALCNVLGFFSLPFSSVSRTVLVFAADCVAWFHSSSAATCECYARKRDRVSACFCGRVAPCALRKGQALFDLFLGACCLVFHLASAMAACHGCVHDAAYVFKCIGQLQSVRS